MINKIHTEILVKQKHSHNALAKLQKLICAEQTS